MMFSEVQIVGEGEDSPIVRAAGEQILGTANTVLPQGRGHF
jgi:hypothetical protein